MLAEAAAAGVPLVASSVGGVPEMCLDERNGLLVPPGDPEGLSWAVGRLLRDPAMAARLGAEGRVVARERYDIATQAGRLCDLYREVMSA